ncbi:hypothetical protein HNY73_019360 [Argiope bruennichi]|uniref:Uncharacterized protein n=1 Tax=Argiope bruennichi TaxID=94029 RepID=A0A8T0EGJ5_ARGBR|nr:hypothetical protein HNY73_019360 [Argiope bruennichi]
MTHNTIRTSRKCPPPARDSIRITCYFPGKSTSDPSDRLFLSWNRGMAAVMEKKKRPVVDRMLWMMHVITMIASRQRCARHDVSILLFRYRFSGEEKLGPKAYDGG